MNAAACPRRLRLLASGALASGGAILMGMGVYFVFMRPALLPEDADSIGVTMIRLQADLPGLLPWLDRVFGVLGGYMIATGLLTVYVAITSFRAGKPGTTTVVAVSGLVSIGWMAVTNFALGSDFKWLLSAFTLPWFLALALVWAGATSYGSHG